MKRAECEEKEEEKKGSGLEQLFIEENKDSAVLWCARFSRFNGEIKLSAPSSSCETLEIAIAINRKERADERRREERNGNVHVM